jgi:phosphoglycerol transferase MdoB-like AlkP superfamily enzyme
VSAQVRHGVSGDGQMIVNTGLLPITDGAASFRFPHNTYPALSHLYKKTGLIAASSLSYWNQKFMSQSYGIKQNYVVKAVDDKHIVEKYLEVKSQHDFLIVLTMSTHAPFNYCTQNVYQKTEGMPDEIYNYLNSVKYMDMQLAMLLKDIKENPITNSSTVVITADHSGLSRDLRKQFEAFSKEHNLGFSNISGHIPLLIYSPQIENKTIINDPIYQMDIYPTLLHLLGCDKYYWKGVGVNLLEQDAWVHRPISPNEAQVLSDKIIRANYFEKIKK